MTTSYELTSLEVISAHLDGLGRDQNYTSDLNYSLERLSPTAAALASASTNLNYESPIGGVPQPTWITTTFTGTLPSITLTSGSYRLSIGMNNMPSGGAFASFDGITLSGNAIPEPSVAMLVLGGPLDFLSAGAWPKKP